jgi:hypothetical protein
MQHIHAGSEHNQALINIYIPFFTSWMAGLAASIRTAKDCWKPSEQ